MSTQYPPPGGPTREGQAPQAPYGQAPQPAFGQAQPAHDQSPYGQAPYAAHGQETYAQAPWGQGGYGLPQNVTYATWPRRVAAGLIDSLVQLPGLILYFIGFFQLATAPTQRATVDERTGTIVNGSTVVPASAWILIGVGMLIMLAVSIWNRYLKMGRTGQSVGKKVMGITLVKEQTGQPIGAGFAFLRDLAHQIDGILYIGYLWPLWDAKRQTIADKICSTVVLDTPKQ